MAGRIVLFGATGYTGRLTAEAMIARGLRPVLAARSGERLAQLVSELGGGLETTVADVSDPPSVRALVGRGDVLVTTVGPFVRWGAPAATAAAEAGAHYVDSTGEAPFIREIFERYGPVAEAKECGMLTAFGYDYVPGNLAAGIALRRAGDAAVRVDTGYFFTGRGEPSGGTAASAAGIVAAPAFAYRDGRVRTERAASRYRTFAVRSKELGAISVGASEHFTLPRIAPRLREVNVYIGWFGPASRALQLLSPGMSAAMKLPLGKRVWRAASARVVKGSTGGPDTAARAKSGSHIVAIAYDAADRQLSEVHLTGVNGYTFTGAILAWGAARVADGALRRIGALGPVDAFGLDELAAGCAEAGISEPGAHTDPPSQAEEQPPEPASFS